MAHRITVQSLIPDARAASYRRTITKLFPRAGLSDVTLTYAYTVDAKLAAAQLKRAAACLTNPVIERSSTSSVLAPKRYAFAVEIGYLPGVTDNVGRTAKETIEDAVGKKFGDGEAVYSSLILFLDGKLSRKEVETFARELHNPLIQRASIRAHGERFPVVAPKVAMHEAARADEVDLDVPDVELARIGKEGIASADNARRGPLALSLPYMKAIQAHFKKLGRKPTDVEIESLAQTWSEHCKHTIFADPLDDISKGIYRTYIKGATEKIRKQKGKKDFCVSVFKDNSGAIAFDDDYLVTHKVETHNSPSALDPFGGSVTAIGGVNRDCLGFGLGAKPIANVYGFFVADPTDETPYFRDSEKEQPLLSNRRILEGIIRGINSGGNESGIPTPLGFVAIDPSYRAKPLVFGGTIGLIPRAAHGRKLYEKQPQPGDYIVMAGGRVGLDGIHGATFSSESLSKGSPATSVQIGDPITQKKLSDALIREARDAGLYSAITDNGAGGLSSSVGEMARDVGGCIIDLEKAPLKYPGLAPWQIWISESQERMTLAVPKRKWKSLKNLFDRHDVEATVIGEFTAKERCVVRYRGKKVMDLDMDFLHDGRPVGKQVSKKPQRALREPGARERTHELSGAILSLIARPSVGSTSFIAQQYDHEVQGTSVTKPLQGRGRVNVDAAVMQPLLRSSRGIVLSDGYCPWYSPIDTYAMAAAAIDTAVRNAIAAGASREELAILDNFCWSSSDTPERLYELKEAARACYDVATAYGTPFISGKDSMFNDFRGYTAAGEKIHLAALPTLLISALGVIPDIAAATTIDLKCAGDIVYLLGETNDELGGSEYFAMISKKTGTKAPKVNTKKNVRTYDALARATERGLVASAASVSRGGLAATLAKSAIAGQLGASVDLRTLPGAATKADSILFSESQGRILVSIRPDAREEFEKLFKGVAHARIGTVADGPLTIALPRASVSLTLKQLTENYRSFFKEW